MWDILGVPVNDADLAELTTNPGALQNQRWLSVGWKKPKKEAAPCWWLANAGEPNKAKEPVFVCRSLVCVMLELSQSKGFAPSFSLFKCTLKAKEARSMTLALSCMQQARILRRFILDLRA